MRTRVPAWPARLALSAAVIAAVSGCGRGRPSIRVIAELAPVVTAAVPVGGDIWVGSLAGLTTLSGGKSELYAEAAGLPKGAQVRGIFPRGDVLWLATNAGVAEFSLKTRRVTRVWTSKDGLGAESVRWVGELGGRIWAGTIFGASAIAPGERRWRNYRIAQGLIQDHVYVLAEAGGAIWASCINGGLVRLDRGAGRWTAVPQDHGLGNKHIYSMMAEADSLWMGTAGGVNLFRVGARAWDQATCDDGFTDYCVRAIVAEGRNLWFGTSYGLYRRNLDTGAQDVFTKANGLPDDEVTSIVRDGGRLIVAVKTGVVEVLPKGK